MGPDHSHHIQDDFFGPAPLARKITIVINGDPVAKGRPRVRLVKNTFKQIIPILYPPKETEDYEARIASAARKAIGDGVSPIETACQVRIRIFEGIPKSWSKKDHMSALSGITRPESRPDGDNYLKGALDGMNGIVYKDDSQVVDMSASKYYSDNPRMEIEVFLQ